MSDPDARVPNLELNPEAMREMGEAAVRAVVADISALPSAPRLNLPPGSVHFSG